MYCVKWNSRTISLFRKVYIVIVEFFNIFAPSNDFVFLVSFLTVPSVMDRPSASRLWKPRLVCSLHTSRADLKQGTPLTLSLKGPHLQHGCRKPRRLSASERKMLQSDAFSVWPPSSLLPSSQEFKVVHSPGLPFGLQRVARYTGHSR